MFRAGTRWRFVAGAYFSFLFYPLFALGLIYRGAWWLFPAALVMIVVPMLDYLAKDDLKSQRLALSEPQRFLLKFAPVLFIFGNAAVIGLTAHIFASLPTSEKLFAVLSVGMIGSIGITAAHELVHKPDSLSKRFGRLGLANVCYLHFEINHIQGHHIRVGTQDDQSTAWFGESLYKFFFRTIPGCLRLSWELERRRLRRRGVPTISSDNQMIQFAFLQGAYIGAIWYVGKWPGVSLFLLQAVIAVGMLETTAYIEHYGLLRSKGPDGRYEPMSPSNSWDCYGRFSNYLVFQLQRHADHHSHPTRDFLQLEYGRRST